MDFQVNFQLLHHFQAGYEMLGDPPPPSAGPRYPAGCASDRSRPPQRAELLTRQESGPNCGPTGPHTLQCSSKRLHIRLCGGHLWQICTQSSWNFTYGVPPARARSITALSRAAIAPGQGFGLEAMPKTCETHTQTWRPRLIGSQFIATAECRAHSSACRTDSCHPAPTRCRQPRWQSGRRPPRRPTCRLSPI